MRYTKKVYYENPDQMKCIAKIININGDEIELDQTVAYPEGGGQEGDHGIITLVKNPKIKIRFNDTQLSMASILYVENFPNCKINGVIFHKIAQEDINFLTQLTIGDEIIIEIDQVRRRALSKSHTAVHLMYMAIDQYKKNIVQNTIGCHIKIDSGRLDFSSDYKFTQNDLKKIEELTNNFIIQNYPIKIFSRIEAKEARYWEANGYIIPCGGTHINNTGEINYLTIHRKNIGKGKERIYFKYKS